MNVLRSIAALFLLACSSCTFSDQENLTFPVEIEYLDNPANQRIDLLLSNNYSFDICLAPEFWPRNGTLIDEGVVVSLNIDGVNYPARTLNSYCFSCSHTRVRPGEKVHSYLSYDVFSLPSNVTDRPKTLNFNAFATRRPNTNAAFCQ